MRWPISPAGFALLVSLASAAGASHAEPHSALGAAIFGGRAERLDSEAAARRVAQLPCKSCHGADGLGGQEGRVPPIDGPALSRVTQERRAYDRASFASAVRSGVAAGGRDLSRLMPRYALSDREAAALFDYLTALPQIQRTGVGEASVTFGIPAITDREGADYLAHLKTAMEARLGGARVYGRQVEFVFLTATTLPDDAGVFAALALPQAWLPSYLEAGVPVLFPFGQLEGDEDPGLLRDFLPSTQDLRRALAKSLAADADGAVAILPAGAEAAALAESLTMAGGTVANDTGAASASEVVVLDAKALERMLSEAPRARLWLDRRLLAPARRLPPARPVVVYTGLGQLVTELDVPPIEAHARIAGGLLAEVLLQAGRDVTRAGFLRAFADAHLSGFRLDYSANPLTGGAPVRFDALGSSR
ncbi:c-type cytochrome [Alterinioella nitratireducens]|uniref:c-type cytochrome n=1 Tax=Alterinioella nitratireducens TaxID=2735915 RepID=UPI001551D413|nr:cytochrome c [Alterinioella nitratireducens]NPD21217.1 cytochrome c [Alterinioella nitratireducens]